LEEGVLIRGGGKGFFEKKTTGGDITRKGESFCLRGGGGKGVLGGKKAVRRKKGKKPCGACGERRGRGKGANCEEEESIPKGGKRGRDPRQEKRGKKKSRLGGKGEVENKQWEQSIEKKK